ESKTCKKYRKVKLREGGRRTNKKFERGEEIEGEKSEKKSKGKCEVSGGRWRTPQAKQHRRATLEGEEDLEKRIRTQTNQIENYLQKGSDGFECVFRKKPSTEVSDKEAGRWAVKRRENQIKRGGGQERQRESRRYAKGRSGGGRGKNIRGSGNRSGRGQRKRKRKGREGITLTDAAKRRRRGQRVSPSLFKEKWEKKNEGGTVIGEVKIFCLKFADDVIALADTREGLQSMLNDLGGRRNRRDKWVYEGKELEIVKEYKYLGQWITSTNSYGV
ncbi:hypothetical protein TSAR_007232, partial [Trichomalopsis sarcophagae]